MVPFLAQSLFYLYLILGTTLILYWSVKAILIRKQWILEGTIQYSDNDFPGIVIDSKGKIYIDHALKLFLTVAFAIIIWPFFLKKSLQ